MVPGDVSLSSFSEFVNADARNKDLGLPERSASLCRLRIFSRRLIISLAMTLSGLIPTVSLPVLIRSFLISEFRKAFPSEMKSFTPENDGENYLIRDQGFSTS